MVFPWFSFCLTVLVVIFNKHRSHSWAEEFNWVLELQAFVGLGETLDSRKSHFLNEACRDTESHQKTGASPPPQVWSESLNGSLDLCKIFTMGLACKSEISRVVIKGFPAWSIGRFPTIVRGYYQYFLYFLYLLLTTYDLRLTTYYVLLTTHYLLLATYYVPLTTSYYFIFTTFYSSLSTFNFRFSTLYLLLSTFCLLLFLLTTSYMLLATYYLVFTFDYSLQTTGYLLCTTYYLLFYIYYLLLFGQLNACPMTDYECLTQC